jgi:hypothetical protein
MEQVRQVVHKIDPSRVVFGMKMLTSILADALQPPRPERKPVGVLCEHRDIAAVGLNSLIRSW